MKLTLPPLPYAYDALMPVMSAETLKFHHDKHHAAYIDAANKLIVGTGLEELSLEEAIRRSHAINPALFNNLAQHYNHLHFWNWMKPDGGGESLPRRLEDRIVADFGSLESMKKAFVEAGIKQFGSGWVWVAEKDGKLTISTTANGENPLINAARPVLGCDLWEHAYYIDYRNARADYIKAFLEKLVNWIYVDEQLGRTGAD